MLIGLVQSCVLASIIVVAVTFAERIPRKGSEYSYSILHATTPYGSSTSTKQPVTNALGTTQESTDFGVGEQVVNRSETETHNQWLSNNTSRTTAKQQQYTYEPSPLAQKSTPKLKGELYPTKILGPNSTTENSVQIDYDSTEPLDYRAKDFSKVVDANNNFGWDLYNNLIPEKPNSNFVFSPFSLFTLVAMLQSGAGGETLKEIHESIRYDGPSSQVNDEYKALRSNLKESLTDDTLATSNRVYIQKHLKLETGFQNELKLKFDSPPESIDFTSKTAAAKLINQRVADDTHGKITKLIEQSVLTNSTRMIALSTLYFKQAWLNVFQGRATKQRPFLKHGRENVSVETMNTEDYFRVADLHFLNAKAIALPYEGQHQEMIIVLPNESSNLGDLECKLKTGTNYAYKDIIKQLNEHQPKNVVLFLPKFSLKSTLDLKDTLMKMGVNDAFDEMKSNFTRIAGENEQLYLSKVLQQAFLNVEEAGSEAGAASYGAVFTPLSIGPVIEETIHVNRPFMGFIRDIRNDLVLFTFRKVE